MIGLTDILSLKRKFATALSKLHTDSGIPLENISDKLVAHELFDFMEHQQLQRFMELSYESMARELFDARPVFSENIDTVIYWAGLQTIGLSLNLGIPLKQVALLCPLDEMCAHFAIYHEMGDLHLFKEFQDNEGQRSILRALRKRAGLSTRMLSELSGIPEPTIKHYEKANENLFSASFANIEALALVLDAPLSLFRRRSRFVPLSEALFADDEFRGLFKERLAATYGKPDLAVEYDLPLVWIRVGAETEGSTEDAKSEAHARRTDRHRRCVPDICIRQTAQQAFDALRLLHPDTLWF